MVLPTNPITQTLTYNTRLLISDNQTNPVAWEVSKTEDTNPIGITLITMKQDLFNPNTDNKDLMLADYYTNNMNPDNSLGSIPEITIKYSSSAAIKVGGSYKNFLAVSKQAELDDTLVSWSIDGLSENDYSSLLSPNTIKIKANRDFTLIGKTFDLKLFYDGKLVDQIKVEVIAL